jgi:SAM-dependent methyltransferase
MNVLEIGPGSGLTAFKLARVVESITLVDTSTEAVAELDRKLGGLSNVRSICADLSKRGLAGILKQRYDVAFAMDVFEYVTDPAAGLRNFAEALRPGGELFLTLPNTPPPVGDGVTYFHTMEQLEDMLKTAGFDRWTAFTVVLRPYASFLYRLLHEVPISLYRRLRAAHVEDRPQTFERAWSFQHRQSLERLKVPVHLVWMVLGWLMHLGGSVFASRPASNETLKKQLVIRAWRGEDRPASDSPVHALGEYGS